MCTLSYDLSKYDSQLERGKLLYEWVRHLDNDV